MLTYYDLIKMLKPRKKKTWANKVNSLQTEAFTQKQAWAFFLAKSDLEELPKPTFEDVFTIFKDLFEGTKP